MCSFAGVPPVPTSESGSPFRGNMPCRYVESSHQIASEPASLSAAVRIGLVRVQPGHAWCQTLPLAALPHFWRSHFSRLVSGDVRV